MKKALKIIGGILGSLILVFLVFALINKISSVKMAAYIDSFEPVVIENRLTPEEIDGVKFFTTDGDFRVMQLTDVHIGGGVFSIKKDKMAINAVAAMITEEKPDLVIVTGDISFAVPYISGTINNKYAHDMFIRLMERLGVYWTVTFGNHDSEAYNYHKRATVSKLYSDDSLKYCLFTPDGDMSGEGNHVISVKNSKGLVTESFFMIDTHSYTDEDPLGIKWIYDCVKEDQIAWYKSTVESLNERNAAILATLSDSERERFSELATPKSLVFCHIPLREVKVAYDEYTAQDRQDTENVKFLGGNDGEEDPVVYSSNLEENFFETILELGSTTALFFGHDHYNNFVIEYKGVKLSYGFSIDYLAYSGIAKEGYQRGCTMITCDESGNAEIVHENYYNDKYRPLYEKEAVSMDKQ